MKALALFAIASLLGNAAFAEDMCSANLQQLDDQSLGMPLGDPLEQQVETLREAAIQAQLADDVDGCVTQSAKALQLLENSSKGDHVGD